MCENSVGIIMYANLRKRGGCYSYFYQSKFVTRVRERERENARCYSFFYQSKDVTGTSLIVCTLPGKLRFSKLWSCKISILKLCAHLKLLSPLWNFFFTFARIIITIRPGVIVMHL